MGHQIMGHHFSGRTNIPFQEKITLTERPPVRGVMVDDADGHIWEFQSRLVGGSGIYDDNACEFFWPDASACAELTKRGFVSLNIALGHTACMKPTRHEAWVRGGESNR